MKSRPSFVRTQRGGSLSASNASKQVPSGMREPHLSAPEATASPQVRPPWAAGDSGKRRGIRAELAAMASKGEVS